MLCKFCFSSFFFFFKRGTRIVAGKFKKRNNLRLVMKLSQYFDPSMVSKRPYFCRNSSGGGCGADGNGCWFYVVYKKFLATVILMIYREELNFTSFFLFFTEFPIFFSIFILVIVFIRFFISLFKPIDKFFHLIHENGPAASRVGLFVPLKNGIF